MESRSGMDLLRDQFQCKSVSRDILRRLFEPCRQDIKWKKPRLVNKTLLTERMIFENAGRENMHELCDLNLYENTTSQFLLKLAEKRKYGWSWRQKVSWDFRRALWALV
eukprot:542453-Amorphochlora_amoeboformis.AAC.1